MDIQDRINELMKERGWSVYRLAKEAGLSQSTITNIFRRNNAPTFSTLEAVCNAFGLSLAQFFSGKDEPIELTDQQRALFQSWCKLTEKQREILLDLMDTM